MNPTEVPQRRAGHTIEADKRADLLLLGGDPLAGIDAIAAGPLLVFQKRRPGGAAQARRGALMVSFRRLNE